MATGAIARNRVGAGHGCTPGATTSFISNLIDLVAGGLVTPVSAETQRLLEGRAADRDWDPKPMGDNGKAVITLTSGHEDDDQVTIAFLVATAALIAGKPVDDVLTKETVRLGLPGYADAIE